MVAELQFLYDFMRYWIEILSNGVYGVCYVTCAFLNSFGKLIPKFTADCAALDISCIHILSTVEVKKVRSEIQKDRCLLR